MLSTKLVSKQGVIDRTFNSNDCKEIKESAMLISIFEFNDKAVETYKAGGQKIDPKRPKGL